MDVFYVLDMVLQSPVIIGISVIIYVSVNFTVHVSLYVLSIANIHYACNVDIQWSSTYVSFCCCDYLY